MVTIKRFLIFIFVFTINAWGFNTFTPTAKDFEVIYSDNIRGDMYVIGNHNLCNSNNGRTCRDPGDWDTRRRHVNINNVAGLESNTRAQLQLEDGDVVVEAWLFWLGAVLPGRYNQAVDRVRFNTPTTTGYVDVVSDADKRHYIQWGDWRDYTGAADVTEWVQQSGDYWVADIKAESGTGSFAGWNLVVVVENQQKSLRNMTIFDGFVGLDDASVHVPNNVTVTLDGFLTPFNGDFDSSLSFFGTTVFTGNNWLTLQDIDGNFQNISNAVNPFNNIYNSTISSYGQNVTTRTPSWPHTSGMDLDIFDISNILGNGQSSTQINLRSDHTLIYVTNFTFSTELYEPRVCYVQEILDINLEPLQSVTVGQDIVMDIIIANRPRVVGEFIEDAQGVQVSTILDQDNLTYVEDSIQVKNVGELHFDAKTDAVGDDIAEFLSDSNTTVFRVGEDADSETGGTLKPNDHVDIRFNTTVTTAGSLELNNRYYVTYRNDDIGMVIENFPIEECVDFNTSISVLQPPTGNFNVVHDGADMSSGDPLDGDDPKNALYTQITNQTFDVDVVSLDDDEITLKNFENEVLVEMVDGSGIDDTEASCLAASTFTGTQEVVEFNGANKVTLNTSLDRSHRDVRFRVSYIDWSSFNHMQGINCSVSSTGGNHKGVPACGNAANKLEQMFPGHNCGNDCESNNPDDWACFRCLMDYSDTKVCSRDNFAVRPNSLLIDVTSVIPDPMIAGSNYTIEIHALDVNDNIDTGYNQSISNLDTNETRYLRDMSVDTGGVLVGDMNVTSTTDFINGVSTNAIVSYDDVGAVDVVFTDSDWASVDAKDALVQPNSLEIEGTLSFRAIPHRFEFASLDLANHDTNYTYLSDDLNMSAKIAYELQALNEDGNLTRNYGDRSAGLWEQNVTFANSLRYDDLSYSDKNATFKPMVDMDLDFNSGVANINATHLDVIEFNFTREADTPHEPFVLSGVDLDATNFEIEVTDADSVSGNGTTAGGSTTFYYANLYAPDIRTSANPVDANIYIEVYCKDGSSSVSCSTLSTPSVDRMNWYHFDGSDGHQLGSGELIDSSATGTVNLSNEPTDLDDTNTIRAQYTGSNNFYRTKVTLDPDSWLSYHPHIPYTTPNNQQNSFYIEWNLGAAGWAGDGDRDGQFVDGNKSGASGISRDNHNRINW